MHMQRKIVVAVRPARPVLELVGERERAARGRLLPHDRASVDHERLAANAREGDLQHEEQKDEADANRARHGRILAAVRVLHAHHSRVVSGLSDAGFAGSAFGPVRRTSVIAPFDVATVD